jgi:hypothetical protein
VFGELAVVKRAIFAGMFEAVEVGDAAQVECAGEFGIGRGVFAGGAEAEAVEIGEGGGIGECCAGGIEECSRGGGWFERSQVFADRIAEDCGCGREFVRQQARPVVEDHLAQPVE